MSFRHLNSKPKTGHEFSYVWVFELLLTAKTKSFNLFVGSQVISPKPLNPINPKLWVLGPSTVRGLWHARVKYRSLTCFAPEYFSISAPQVHYLGLT